MKQCFIAVLLLLSVQLYAQEKLIVPMWKIHVFEDIKDSDIIRTQDLGRDRTEPLLAQRGEWYIPTWGKMRIYNPDFSLRRVDTCNTLPYTYEIGERLRTYVIGNAFSNCINLMYVDGRYLNKDIMLENDPGSSLGIYGNMIIYKKIIDGRYNYVGYEIQKDGSYKVYSHGELSGYKTFEYKDDLLYYYGVPVSGFEVIDDDGNMYYKSTMQSANALLKLDSDTSGLESWDSYYRESMFDDEGNYWEIRYTEDPSFVKPVLKDIDYERPSGIDLHDPNSHPVAWYSGRTWGYKDPPKPAVVIDDGLRLRLRANTSAFVLGTLSKNQTITILKTGEKATIGGVNAPWYRVKTEDGLVGWAFGGFIKVTEN